MQPAHRIENTRQLTDRYAPGARATSSSLVSGGLCSLPEPHPRPGHAPGVPRHFGQPAHRVENTRQLTDRYAPGARVTSSTLGRRGLCSLPEPHPAPAMPRAFLAISGNRPSAFMKLLFDALTSCIHSRVRTLLSLTSACIAAVRPACAHNGGFRSGCAPHRASA